jgi:hypothetical protein
MIYGAMQVIRYLLGKDIAGRSLAVYPDDTFIVSYPRSGNTWTRFLIANLTHPHQAVTFANIERLIPDCEAQSSRYLKRIPRPRVIKSHEYFDHRYNRVIYIVRDPRDVALSYYDFQRKYRQIQDGYPLAQYVHDFVAGSIGSADWGTWGENVGSWIGTRMGRPGFLLLRYEDLAAEPEKELVKIASVFGIDPSSQLLATTIDRSSAQRMRELELSQGSDWVATRDKRKDIPFIGAASSGGWKTLLCKESVAEIESAWGPLMTRLGYGLTTQSDVAQKAATDGEENVCNPRSTHP